MASPSILFECLEVGRQAGVSMWLWGQRGVGKSALVRQFARRLRLELVDVRCAQLDAADLRGFPDRGPGGRMVFYPPAELPSSGAGVLLLDELNLARSDVLAATFQLVLDRRLGDYVLPDEWSVVCTGVTTDVDITPSDLDPAFLDRFCHLTFSGGETTFPEWAEWMRQEHGAWAEEVIAFCAGDGERLETLDGGDLGFRIRPSRRAWEMVLRCLTAWEAGGHSDRARVELLAGLVGRDLALAFDKCRGAILPEQLVRAGVQSSATQLASLGRDQLSALSWGLSCYLEGRLQDSTLSAAALDFVEYLLTREKDMALAFCASLQSRGKAQRDRAVLEYQALLLNPRVAALLAKMKTTHNLTKSPKAAVEFIDYLAARPALANQLADLAAGEVEM